MDNNIKDNNIVEAEINKPFGNKELNIWAVIISIIVGAAFALLVIRDFVGINMFLFSLIAISGVGYMLHKDNNLDFKNFVFFGGAFLLYASLFFRLKFEVFTVLTFPTLLGLLVLTTMFSAKAGAKQGVLTFLYRMFGVIARVDKIFVGISTLSKGKRKNKQKSLQVLFGVLISVGLLIIVIPLMVSAEAAFADFVNRIIDKIQLDFDFGKFFGKTVAGAAIAIIFCGFLYTFTKDKKIGSKQSEKAADTKDNHTLIITVLSIMGLVFLVFAIVQFNSLFISKEVIVENTTFAETARTGYFQLVVLSVINFIMVLVCTGMQKGSNKTTKNIIKVLTTYFTLLNVYLLVSSAYKMTLYYEAYGLSVERLLVYILLTFEFIALVLLFIKIYKSEMPFIKVIIYYTVAFWAIVSFINIEAWIVNVNGTRYEQTGKLDIYYMTRMSGDASDAIKEFYFDNYDTLCDEGKEAIYDYFLDSNEYYHSDYSFKYGEEYNKLSYDEIHKPESWLEFNFSKWGKYKDGLEVLQHYYDTGHIKTAVKD